MSASTPSAVDLTEKQQRILHYLRENAATKTYFKSRLIGNALGLSAKEVGANMQSVQEATLDLTIEKWGYSSGTTWKVTMSTTHPTAAQG
ncbi:DUF7123 family protein [Halocatena pleomorpha]|uniref:DUF7123 domain-containing protein n=1 Tax=Halocatena pleomorpha TaxID=1785090 RepID=A0A3P3R7A9_9EURY|nr:hypothetical protein [Halocatena pleomorpha]RRJ28888.1 hypothetical protein EIK79_14325 [Halocatena pleomorpha]